ncbi:MAG: 4'-phosphopantetheinyl transferase superfamily protein [Bacteroidota bacterium]
MTQLKEFLSADEIGRGKKFRFEKDQDHFIVARAALRDLLAGYLNCEPKEITFSYGHNGKPFLKDEKIEFNVSHADHTALIGFSMDAPLGVDIEQVRSDIEFELVARHFFSPPEVKTLLALDIYAQTQAFFYCWTRKESFIKALGDGLAFPLDQFEVSLLASDEPLLKSTFWNPAEAQEWSLFSFEPDSIYIGESPTNVGAAAIRQKNIWVSTYEWQFKLPG